MGAALPGASQGMGLIGNAPQNLEPGPSLDEFVRPLRPGEKPKPPATPPAIAEPVVVAPEGLSTPIAKPGAITKKAVTKNNVMEFGLPKPATAFALDPRNVMAQLRSGVIYGLSAALWGGISIDKGRARESNFHDYRVLALADSPPIEVALVSQGSPMGGVGEIGVPPSMPALANAVSRATGKRVRALPILAG